MRYAERNIPQNRIKGAAIAFVGMGGGFGMIFGFSSFEDYRIKKIAIICCQDNGWAYKTHMGFYKAGKRDPMVQRNYKVYVDDENYRVVLMGNYWFGVLSDRYEVVR